MEGSSGLYVSKKPQRTNDYSEVNDKLELFINYFVKEFESKLLFYHLILEGELQKAGKLSDTFSEIVGQGIGGAVGGLIGMILGSAETGSNLGAKAGEIVGGKIGFLVGNKNYTSKVVTLSDLIDLSQKDKINFRLELVKAGFDIFQSFEMQFMRVTTDEGPRKAIRQLAEDAMNRAINCLKQNKDISISESVILGKSNREEVYSLNPGFGIHYEYQSCKTAWNSASLYEKAGVVIETVTNPGYYKKEEGKNRTTKYGYRRLLVRENWDKLEQKFVSDNIVESKSEQFTNYQYIINPDNLEEQSKSLLDKLNSGDGNLQEARIKKMFEDVRKDILDQIDILKKQSRGSTEDRQILTNIRHEIKNLKVAECLEKFNAYFEEFGHKLQLIESSIEQGREENRQGHIKVEECIKVVSQKLDRLLLLQETETDGIISGLGIIKYYYISRKLNRHIEIHEKILEENSKFFMTGNGQIDKSKLQNNEDIILVSNTRKDFETLCKKCEGGNIHWLRKEENKFIWQDSQGSLSELRKFLNDQTVESSEVKKLSNIKDRVVIISAEPGMGKSTLLTHLALEQKKLSKSAKVIKINLNDHTDKLSSVNFESATGILEFLKATSDVRNLKDLKNCILLFDGFDEIASNIDYKRKILKLVRYIKNEKIHLWITTRPYTQYDLEDELSVFSYTIEALSEATQKEFLEKFWTINFTYDIINQLIVKIGSEIEDEQVKNLISQVCKIIELEIAELQDDDDSLKQIQSLMLKFNISKKVESVDRIINLINTQLGKQSEISDNVRDIVEEKIDVEEIKDLIQTRAKSYADELIAKFSESVSDTEREFTGVPLQVRLLAEVFQEPFYEDFKRLYDLEPMQRYLDQPQLPETLNLLDLYERFIKNKHRINFVEKGNTDLTKAFLKEIFEESYRPFIEKHRLLALNLLFSEEDLKQILVEEDREKIERLYQNVGDGTENTGIVYRIIDNKPHFIHRTFAEYFAAHYFVSIRENARSFLIRYIFKAENKVIRHFFDRMLANQYELHMAVLNNDKDKVNELLLLLDLQNGQNIINKGDEGGRTALHLAAAYNHLDIAKILLKHGASINIEDQIFAWKPLSYADKANHWSIVEVLLQKGASVEDMFEIRKNVFTYDKDKITLLHIAAKEGYTKLAEVLVKKLNANVWATEKFSRIPLHFAAGSGNLEIVKILLKKDSKTAKKQSVGETPLNTAVSNGHLEVVRYLSKKSNLTGKEFDEIYLIAAISNGDHELVKTLLEKEVDVNSEVLGWTPLHQACMDGNLKVVQLLVENKAKIDYHNNYHPNSKVRDYWPSVERISTLGPADIVKFLIKADPKIRNAHKNGYTPLHSAARGGHFEVVKYIVEQLEKRKSDINVSDKKGTTPLHLAAYYGRFTIVEYLVRKGANINAVNKWGATPMFNAAFNNNYDIVNFLLDERANIDSDPDQGVIGKLGITVLHLAALYGELGIVKRLVERDNRDVNIGENSFTPLYLAALSDSSETIEYLIDKRAIVDASVNFTNCIKVLKDERKFLKNTSTRSFVEKLIKTCNYLSSFVGQTAYDINRISSRKNRGSLSLRRQNQRQLNRKPFLFPTCRSINSRQAEYFQEQIRNFRMFIKEKKEGTVWY